MRWKNTTLRNMQMTVTNFEMSALVVKGLIGPVDRLEKESHQRDIEQGKKNLARELSSIAEKHLKIEIRDDKKNNKVSQKQYDKFMDLLRVGDSE